MNTTLPSSNVVPFRQPSEPRGYFKLRHSLLGSTNWESLTPDAIAVFIDIVGIYRPHNNGEILYSLEDAKQRFRIGYGKASRAFDALEQHGLLIRTQQGRWDFATKAERETKWAVSDWVLGSQPEPNIPPPISTTEPNTPHVGSHCRTQHKKIDKNIDKKVSKRERESLSQEDTQGTLASDNPFLSSPSPPTPQVPRAPPSPAKPGPRPNGDAMDEDFHWGRFQRPSKLKHPLPEGWRPARDLTPHEEQRLADMHLWVRSEGVEKADWEAFFEIWLTKHTKRQGNDDAKSATAALKRLGEQTGGNANEYIPGSSKPEPLRLDLKNGSEGSKLLPKR